MDEIIEAAVSQARARLEAGESVGEIVRALRDDYRLGHIRVLQVLMAIEPIGLSTARTLVEAPSLEPCLADLRLADLKLLAAVVRLRGSSWLETHLVDALIERRPWLLIVPGEAANAVRYCRAASPDPGVSGTSCGDAFSFSLLRDEIRARAVEPDWRPYVEIVRDEPDTLLIRFLAVKEI